MLLKRGMTGLMALAFTIAGAPARADEDPGPPAAMDEPGRGSAAFRLGYYDNGDDGDGNPFLDESLTVIEAVTVFDYALTDLHQLNGTFSYDNVSSASIDRLSQYPEQSGATGDFYYGLNLGLAYQWNEDVRVGVNTSVSVEYDYRSFGTGVFWARDYANKNATVKLDLSTYFDSIDVIRYNGIEDGSDNRSSTAAALTWYQMLTPRSHMELGGVVSYQSGFLETAYNAVVIEDDSLPPNPALENNARGREITEELPDSRTRFAAHGRYRYALTDLTALEMGGRLYTDTWGVNGVSLEPAAYHWLSPERLRMRLRYRFYTQTAADDYQDSFREETTYRTQDSDLSDFSSHALGLRIDWYRESGFRIDLGGDYVVRSDGLDQIMASSGVQWEF